MIGCYLRKSLRRKHHGVVLVSIAEKSDTLSLSYKDKTLRKWTVLNGGLALYLRDLDNARLLPKATRKLYAVILARQPPSSFL